VRISRSKISRTTRATLKINQWLKVSSNERLPFYLNGLTR
jgi:hypothetical protein